MNVLEEKVFLSSTFFPNSLAQVAALKTIEFLEKNNVMDVIREKGEYFAAGVEKAIEESGVPCEFSGGPWMPFITFKHDPNKLYKKLRKAFYTELIRRKVFLQPYHHGYIAYRHTQEELDYSIEMIKESFIEIKKLIP
jgi:glutamate-1-semialdehyde aminotransferase